MKKSKSTLIIGGARSGKSNFAQQLAQATGEPVLFVATATAIDDEMQQRIEQHRKSRPATWQTLEVSSHLGEQIPRYAGDAKIIVIDCITLLVNNILLPHSAPDVEKMDAVLAEKAVMAEMTELVQCLDRLPARFIMVTNEVGLDLVPANKLGRIYRDVLGKANQTLAGRCDEVYLMVAGIPVLIKGADSPA